MSATVQSASDFSELSGRLVRLPTSLRFVNLTVTRRSKITVRETLKRAVDIAGASALLLVTAPLTLGLAALTSRDGAGAFYGHARVGLDGRSFTCWKVRTMVPDAEARLDAMLESDPARQAEWQRDQKLREDPRVTQLGRFLRKTSLDELPQLWNVLKGDMSLVGPRPVTQAELARYGRSAGHYCSVRPGLTGAWQVRRRSGTTYAERVALDRHYVQTHSLAGDLALLCLTPASIWRGTGH